MDLARIGHIGAEVVVVGGAVYLLMQQNKALQGKVDELSKQLTHVAQHTHTLHREHETRLATLTAEIETLKKPKERPTRTREILRATEESLSPPPRARRARLPVHESDAPVAAATKSASSGDESDPEALLKRA